MCVENPFAGGANPRPCGVLRAALLEAECPPTQLPSSGHIPAPCPCRNSPFGQIFHLPSLASCRSRQLLGRCFCSPWGGVLALGLHLPAGWLQNLCGCEPQNPQGEET